MKYWYCIEIDYCVLCGRKHKTRYRVYNIIQKGVRWKDIACDECWISVPTKWKKNLKDLR